MSVTTITVAQKYPPDPNKKRGRIVDTSGVRYQAMPALLDTMTRGEQYKITYKDDEFKGISFKVIEDAVVVSQPSTPTTSQPTNLTQLSPVSQYGEINRQKREDIFTQGLAQAEIRNPNFDVSKIATVAGCVSLINKWRQAWINTLGSNPQKGRDDMNDEIPDFR